MYRMVMLVSFGDAKHDVIGTCDAAPSISILFVLDSWIVYLVLLLSYVHLP
jgi:hypothetical protein